MYKSYLPEINKYIGFIIQKPYMHCYTCLQHKHKFKTTVQLYTKNKHTLSKIQYGIQTYTQCITQHFYPHHHLVENLITR